MRKRVPVLKDGKVLRDENGNVLEFNAVNQEELGRKIDAPQTAQVGEVLTVEEVDDDGKPTKWKTQEIDIADVVKFTDQELTRDQMEIARRNIGAGVLRQVFYWKNYSGQGNFKDPISVIECAPTGSICLCSGGGNDYPDGMTPPMLVFFGGIDRGYIGATIYDGAGVTWQTTFNLMNNTHDTPTKSNDATMLINITSTTDDSGNVQYSIDETNFDKIYEAYQSGAFVQLYCEIDEYTGMLPIKQCENTYAIFDMLIRNGLGQIRNVEVGIRKADGKAIVDYVGNVQGYRPSALIPFVRQGDSILTPYDYKQAEIDGNYGDIIAHYHYTNHIDAEMPLSYISDDEIVFKGITFSESFAHISTLVWKRTGEVSYNEQEFALIPPATAQVGQIVKVKSVDADGKITGTEAVDMPNGLPTPSPSDIGKCLAVVQTGEHEVGYDFNHLPNINDFVDLGIDSAIPGQILRVFGINDSGNPVAYEAVDIEDVIYDGVTVKSSTTGSTKKFRITVDDSGTLSATEVTEETGE